MARITGVDLPKNKRVEIALTYIFGIGNTTAGNILEYAKVDPNTRVFNLTEDEVHRIQETILAKGIKVEGDLRKEVSQNVKRLIEVGCYRGIRHRRGLPVRGQNTKTNARTRKGTKKTVGAKGKATKK